MTETSSHPGYVDAVDIVQTYGVSSISHVYALASRNGWRRYRWGGKVRYHRGDVDDTLGSEPST